MNAEERIFCEITETEGGRKNVFIIDDDVQMLKIFRYYLMDYYDVSLINSGKAAMECLKEYRPDLVLLDYLMPDCNGAEVLKFINGTEATKEIPVIFLTGVTDEETIRECMSYEPAGYIVKPVAKNALLLKLEQFFSTRH